MGPITEGAIGELFYVMRDAVIVLDEGKVVAVNPVVERVFGCGKDDVSTRLDLAGLMARTADGTVHRVALPPYGVFDMTQRQVGELTALLGHDVTQEVRHTAGLQRIAAVSRALIGSPPTVAEVLQSLVTEAKALTEAAYSALLLLQPGTLDEVSHFVYDAPRELFPERMPRVVGLLAVPITTRAAARLDDMRSHPAGVGLPGVHPPMGPLLAVPVLAGEDVIGEVAVANPPEGRAFDQVDEQLLGDLAAHVAVAVRWAQQVEREREAEQLQQEVVDTARHDIRTPLAAGRGYTTLLLTRRDRMSPEQVDAALEGVNESFQRIEGFTERMLLDRRHALVGVEPTWQDVDLEPILASVAADARAATGRDAVTVQVDGPSVVCADSVMVREVLDNLVGNALKHSPPDRPVVISLRDEGGHARLDVRDEGEGIAEAEQGSLFERWTRTGASRERHEPGFGLGLSIVKRLVTAHAGSLGVSSRPGEGATFWVTLPRQRPS
jgi:two-component system OmpR family sensor kinase